MDANHARAPRAFRRGISQALNREPTLLLVEVDERCAVMRSWGIDGVMHEIKEAGPDAPHELPGLGAVWKRVFLRLITGATTLQ